MKFWDASAVAALLLDEPARGPLLDLLDEDPVMLAWWGTPVECVSAIARREREGALALTDVATVLEHLDGLARAWQEILPGDAVRSTARRLLRVHPLRAADSLQLAAAIVAAEHDPASLPFVCLDERLSDAASREGFRTVRT
ncbi:MAG: type II toxin-antitoxin system VapC family toxin [Gemmatimonadetes bacterium]|nr:type II toxin-antitoxin system VapC family toxin [Gemmatimonadota bacterium]